MKNEIFEKIIKNSNFSNEEIVFVFDEWQDDINLDNNESLKKIIYSGISNEIFEKITLKKGNDIWLKKDALNRSILDYVTEDVFKNKLKFRYLNNFFKIYDFDFIIDNARNNLNLEIDEKLNNKEIILSLLLKQDNDMYDYNNISKITKINFFDYLEDNDLLTKIISKKSTFETYIANNGSIFKNIIFNNEDKNIWEYLYLTKKNFTNIIDDCLTNLAKSQDYNENIRISESDWEIFKKEYKNIKEKKEEKNSILQIEDNVKNFIKNNDNWRDFKTFDNKNAFHFLSSNDIHNFIKKINIKKNLPLANKLDSDGNDYLFEILKGLHSMGYNTYSKRDKFYKDLGESKNLHLFINKNPENGIIKRYFDYIINYNNIRTVTFDDVYLSQHRSLKEYIDFNTFNNGLDNNTWEKLFKISDNQIQKASSNFKENITCLIQSKIITEDIFNNDLRTNLIKLHFLYHSQIINGSELTFKNKLISLKNEMINQEVYKEFTLDELKKIKNINRKYYYSDEVISDFENFIEKQIFLKEIHNDEDIQLDNKSSIKKRKM